MGLPPEEYTPVATPLASTILVIQDGCDPTGANLSIAEKALANGVRDLQNKVAPLAGSGDIQRTGWRFVAGVPGGDAGPCNESYDATLLQPAVQLNGRGAAGWFEIYPPHGQMLREVVVVLRNDTDGPGSTPLQVQLYQQNIFSSVDMGGGLGFKPVLTSLAVGNDPSADEAAMVAIHTAIAAVAGDGHLVDRTTSRYFVKVTTGSGTNTTSGTKTWVFGCRNETRIPAGAGVDQGAG